MFATLTKMFATTAVLASLAWVSSPAAADAQVVVTPTPVVTYYRPRPILRPFTYAPAVTYGAAVSTPVVTSYAPTTTYYAPTTSYYAPATTSYYAPTTTYYAPSVSVPTTSYYAPSVTAPITTYYAPSYVAPVTTYYRAW